MAGVESSLRVTRCRQILQGLPDHNYAVLDYLMGFLHEVSAGQGCRRGLALRVWGRPPSALERHPLAPEDFLQGLGAVTPLSSPARWARAAMPALPLLHCCPRSSPLAFLLGTSAPTSSPDRRGAWGREPEGGAVSQAVWLGEARVPAMPAVPEAPPLG